MKYLLLAAVIGAGGTLEDPDAGPYPSLNDCNKAAIAYIEMHAEEVAQEEGEGIVLKCIPVEERNDPYVR